MEQCEGSVRCCARPGSSFEWMTVQNGVTLPSSGVRGQNPALELQGLCPCTTSLGRGQTPSHPRGASPLMPLSLPVSFSLPSSLPLSAALPVSLRPSLSPSLARSRGALRRALRRSLSLSLSLTATHTFCLRVLVYLVTYDSG